MKVLVACEYTGVVRDAFIAQGHNAISCDIIPSEQQGPHYLGNVLDIINDGFDLMIAHPPCTYLANSGVQHLHRDPTRWYRMENAREFFMKLLEADIPKICVENPIPHRYAHLPKYTQIVEPWMFGHEVTKRTCLWLRGLPNLTPTNIVGRGPRYYNTRNGKSNGSLWYQSHSSNKNYRSRTFQGLADAMAKQWG